MTKYTIQTITRTAKGARRNTWIEYNVVSDGKVIAVRKSFAEAQAYIARLTADPTNGYGR